MDGSSVFAKITSQAFIVHGYNGSIMEDSSKWGKYYQGDILACRSWFTPWMRTGPSWTNRGREKKREDIYLFFFSKAYFSFRLRTRWKGCLTTLILWAVARGLVLAGVLQVERLQPSQSARSLCYLCSEFWTLTVFEEEKKRQGQWLFVSLKGSTVSSGWHSPRTTCRPSCGIVLLPRHMECPVPAFM